MTILPFTRTDRSSETAAIPQSDAAAAGDSHLVLGVLARRYGLLTSEEVVHATGEVDRSGDLAVADRIAFLAACRGHASVLVIEQDGWFIACIADHDLDAADLANLRGTGDSPRIMSLVTERGITPVLAPLVA